jgi:hypothetical protein
MDDLVHIVVTKSAQVININLDTYRANKIHIIYKSSSTYPLNLCDPRIIEVTIHNSWQIDNLRMCSNLQTLRLFTHTIDNFDQLYLGIYPHLKKLVLGMESEVDIRPIFNLLFEQSKLNTYSPLELLIVNNPNYLYQTYLCMLKYIGVNRVIFNNKNIDNCTFQREYSIPADRIDYIIKWTYLNNINPGYSWGVNNNNELILESVIPHDYIDYDVYDEDPSCLEKTDYSHNANMQDRGIPVRYIENGNNANKDNINYIHSTPTTTPAEMYLPEQSDQDKQYERSEHKEYDSSILYTPGTGTIRSAFTDALIDLGEDAAEFATTI